MRHALSVLFLVPLVAARLTAQSHDFTPYLIADRGEEIALARSAAPPFLSDSASVYVLTDSGYVEAAKGTNGFTCFVIRSLIDSGKDSATTWDPRLRAPHCFNPEASRVALPNILYRTRSLIHGMTSARIESGVRSAYASHRWPSDPVGAVVYMLSPRQWLGPTNPAWKPHLMFFLPPDHAPLTMGATQDGKAPLIDAGPNPYGPGQLILAPVEQWSDGTPYVAAGSAEHQN